MERERQTRAPEGAFNDPDRQNSEQNEEGTQAQDVADEALHKDYGEESEPGENANPADPVPRDVPDLVEKENDMLHSGRIDMDAFEGEEKMDDEDE
jgi:hypothetical protein